MKLLIALALFAVAFADEVKVVSLPVAPIPAYTIPDIRPLFVPQAVLDAIKIGQPLVMRDAAIDDDMIRVNFVDAPLNEAEDAQVDEGLRVHVVDSPLDAPEAVVAEYDYGVEPHFVELPLQAPVAEEIIPDAIRIAEPSLPFVPAEDVLETVEVVELPAVEVAEEVYVPGVVNFVDSPLADVEVPAVAEVYVPEAVMIAEAPLPAVEAPAAEQMFVPEPVMLAEAPLPAFESEDAAPVPVVEAVRIAVPSFPGKQFADPRLR